MNIRINIESEMFDLIKNSRLQINIGSKIFKNHFLSKLFDLLVSMFKTKEKSYYFPTKSNERLHLHVKMTFLM